MTVRDREPSPIPAPTVAPEIDFILGDAEPKVLIHDPWVQAYSGDLWSRIEGADAAIIMVSHEGYRNLDLARLKAALKTPVLVDGRHVVETDAARRAGFVFRGLGRGRPRGL